MVFLSLSAIGLGVAGAYLLFGDSDGQKGVSTVRWSDADTWAGRTPQNGDDVTIPRGLNVLLDTSPPPLKSLKVYGGLIFDRKDITLTVEDVEVYGSLQIGTEEQPFTQSATITLTGIRDERDGGHSSPKGITILGGSLDMHGEPQEPSWTRLGQSVKVGSDRIVLDGEVKWRAGDLIVIASSDVDPHHAEERTLASVSGKTLVLDKPLEYDHSGEVRSVNGTQVDERAEVGLLSRSILVQGEDALEQDGLGGHLMILQNSVARITWSEFYHMGQKGELARYPIHFHLANNMQGSYISDNAIHDSFNRCLTIHGTQNVVVERNVAYDTIGHCYFFEDGIETGNVLEANLGMLTRAATMEDALILTDLTPATFWISNPDNVFRDNVAAGSESRGFWFDLPLHPTGPSQSPLTDAQIWPRRTPVREFSGNLSHSNLENALLVGSSAKEGLQPFTPKLTPVPPTSGPDSPGAAIFRNFTAYKNGAKALSLLGENLQVVDARSDDAK